MGKGSGRRKENVRLVRDNYDQIKWDLHMSDRNWRFLSYAIVDAVNAHNSLLNKKITV